MFNNWWRILMGFIWKWNLKNYSLSLLEDFAARESEDTRCVLNPTNGRLKIMIIDLFRCPTVSNGNEYPCSITNTEAMPFLNEVTCFLQKCFVAGTSVYILWSWYDLLFTGLLPAGLEIHQLTNIQMRKGFADDSVSDWKWCDQSHC